MANLRANAERFKQKEQARLQKAAHEQRRLGIVKRHRENTVQVLRNLLQSFPCPVSQPDEAGEEATLALLELASGFSSHKPAKEAIEQYQSEVVKARARRISARDAHENQLLADITGAVCINPELVEITDAGDGQKVPTLPDMPGPWGKVMALALSDEKVPAEKFFEALENDGDKALLRSGLEGAQAVSKDKLQEAYIAMVRRAEDLLRHNKAERAEEAKDAPEPASPEPYAALEKAAEGIAIDLAYAVGVLHSLADADETPPDEVADLKATAARVAAVVSKLKAAAAEAQPTQVTEQSTPPVL